MQGVNVRDFTDHKNLKCCCFIDAYMCIYLNISHKPMEDEDQQTTANSRDHYRFCNNSILLNSSPLLILKKANNITGTLPGNMVGKFAVYY